MALLHIRHARPQREPTHTDRDGRIKVQFHWQRGAQSSHRLSHPADNNAPGDATAGTWVRVGQAWAGANWGGAFIPRVGQEDKDKLPTGDWNAELAGLNAALKEAQVGG